MLFTTSAMATATLALLSTVNAHMIMKSPVPYGNPNSSPLLDSGADFPCKAVPYDVVTMNNIEVGVPQTLSFTGSAVHGGGSCQISVTLDQKPDKNSQWKVIHSIIGGCPSNVTGNLPEAAISGQGDGAAQFEFTMPKGMPNGQYTLAWTWNNKVGNREMYMNCAPITVTGGGNDNSVMEKLPDMFVVNIPAETCSLPEGVDFVYPNPGDSVDRVTVGTPNFGSSLVGNCASMTKMGAGAGTLGNAGNAEPTGKATGGASAPAATSAAATPSASNPGGIFAPGASSAADPAPTSFATLVIPSSAAAAPSVPAAPSSAAAAPSAPAASAPPASGAGVPCSTNGAVVCIGSTQFGICNWGFATPQDLAAGTTCSNGSINVKRRAAPRRLPIHFRRHGSNLI